MLLGAEEWVPRPVVMPAGSQPVTETRRQIEDSGFFKKVENRSSAVYSDGNVNWARACVQRKQKHHDVTHQVQTFVQSVHPCSIALSAVAGTQVLHRFWQSLKFLLPPRTNAKTGIDNESCLSPTAKQKLYMSKGVPGGPQG